MRQVAISQSLLKHKCCLLNHVLEEHIDKTSCVTMGTFRPMWFKSAIKRQGYEPPTVDQSAKKQLPSSQVLDRAVALNLCSMK